MSNILTDSNGSFQRKTKLVYQKYNLKVVSSIFFIYLCSENYENEVWKGYLEDGRLWAVIYDGEAQNALDKLFDQWNRISLTMKDS